MVNLRKALGLALCCFIIFSGISYAQEMEKMKLDYVTPLELIESLDISNSPSGYHLKLDSGYVRIRINQAINELLIYGSQREIEEAKKVINFYDVAPRQIIIEVKIVKINNQKSKEAGFDWQNILNGADFAMGYRKYTEERKAEDYIDGEKQPVDKNIDNVSETMMDFTLRTISLSHFLKLVEEKNIGEVVNVPRIVTTNNKEGHILDGHRIKYVARYSSYSNIYETEELTSGLSLAVTPSLGQSGYLKLDVDAKLTSLGQIISGSPSESGQMLENTVIVENNKPFLLGGFKKTETREVRSGIPVLGRILPFLFSKKKNVEITKDILLILKPKVIDLESAAIPDTLSQVK